MFVYTVAEQARDGDQDAPPKSGAGEHTGHQGQSPAGFLADLADLDGGEDGGEGHQGDGICDHHHEGRREITDMIVEALGLARRNRFGSLTFLPLLLPLLGFGTTGEVAR